MSKDKGLLTPERFRIYAEQMMLIRVLIDHSWIEGVGEKTRIRIVLFRASRGRFFYGMEYEYGFPSMNFFQEGYITDLSPYRAPWEVRILGHECDDDPPVEDLTAEEHKELSNARQAEWAARPEEEQLRRIVAIWERRIPAWAQCTPHVACLRKDGELSEIALSDLRLFEAYGRLQTALAYEIRLDHASLPNREQVQRMVNLNPLYGEGNAIGNFNEWAVAVHGAIGGFMTAQRRQLTRSGINI